MRSEYSFNLQISRALSFAARDDYSFSRDRGVGLNWIGQWLGRYGVALVPLFLFDEISSPSLV